MNWSYDKALELLRSWKQPDDPPILILDLAISSLAYATARCEVVDVSDETLTLAFGRVAWGSCQIEVPLRNTNFKYVEVSDTPDEIKAHNNPRMVGCLELRFSGNDGGCFITEIKRGTFTWVEKIGRVVIEEKPPK
jgi:hypothetical protein